MEQKRLSLEKMNKEIIVLKQEMAKIKAIFEEDLEFARQTAEAWSEIDSGKGITLSKEKFLEELKNW